MFLASFTWLMITYLASGEINTVTKVEDAIACIDRSKFEMRFDPQVKSTYCMLLMPETEA